MKTLTPAERTRRAAVLGIILPAPATEAPPQANDQAHKITAPLQPRPVGKLTATPAMQRATASRPTPVPAPPPPPPEPPAVAEPARNRRRRQWPPAEYAVFQQVRDLLVERYRPIFAAARPLAIGIDQKLREAFTEEELPTADLKAFLRIWVHRHAYRAALQRGDHRVNLDGSDAGPAFGSPPAAVEGD